MHIHIHIQHQTNISTKHQVSPSKSDRSAGKPQPPVTYQVTSSGEYLDYPPNEGGGVRNNQEPPNARWHPDMETIESPRVLRTMPQSSSNKGSDTATQTYRNNQGKLSDAPADEDPNSISSPNYQDVSYQTYDDKNRGPDGERFWRPVVSYNGGSGQIPGGGGDGINSSVSTQTPPPRVIIDLRPPGAANGMGTPRGMVPNSEQWGGHQMNVLPPAPPLWTQVNPPTVTMVPIGHMTMMPMMPMPMATTTPRGENTDQEPQNQQRGGPSNQSTPAPAGMVFYFIFLCVCVCCFCCVMDI